MTSNWQRKERAKLKLDEKIARDIAAKQRKLRVVQIFSLFVVLAIAGGALVFYLKDKAKKADAKNRIECNYINSSQPQPPKDRKVNLPTLTNPYKIGSKKIFITIQSKNRTTTLQGTLDLTKSPCAINNLENLVHQKYYQNTYCHRMVTEKNKPIFVQCGDPSATGLGNPGYNYSEEYPTNDPKLFKIEKDYQKLKASFTEKTISEAEYNKKAKALILKLNKFADHLYGPGVIAMANSGQNTSAAQFFIMAANFRAQPLYSIIGKLDEESIKALNKIMSYGVVNNLNSNNPNIQDGKPKVPINIVAIEIK